MGANSYCAWYDNAQWYNQYYQYRIPVEVTTTASGLQELNISLESIAVAINQLEVIHCSEKFVDFNHVKVVEYDSGGNIVDEVDSAGFYLSFASSEVITNGSFESVEGSGLPTGWSGSTAVVQTCFERERQPEPEQCIVRGSIVGR